MDNDVPLNLDFLKAAPSGDFFRESFIDPMEKALPHLMPRIREGYNLKPDEKKQLQDFALNGLDHNRFSYFLHLVKHASDEHPLKEYARFGIFKMVREFQENKEFASNFDALVDGVRDFLKITPKELSLFNANAALLRLETAPDNDEGHHLDGVAP